MPPLCQRRSRALRQKERSERQLKRPSGGFERRFVFQDLATGRAQSGRRVAKVREHPSIMKDFSASRLLLWDKICYTVFILTRGVGMFEKRSKFFALSDGVHLPSLLFIVGNLTRRCGYTEFPLTLRGNVSWSRVTLYTIERFPLSLNMKGNSLCPLCASGEAAPCGKGTKCCGS